MSNVLSVARREFTWRARSRTFLFSTLFLLVVAVGLALAPTIISYVDRSTSEKVAVHVGAADLQANPVGTLDALLNAQAQLGTGEANGTGQTGGSGGSNGSSASGGAKDFVVSQVPDLALARQAVIDGQLNAVLEIARAPSGDLAFTLYTNDRPSGQTAQLVQQATTAIAIQDRLARAGVAPGQQASLFVPPDYTIANPDPTKTEPSQPGLPQDIANTAVGTALSIFIFMAIVLYGTWVAMSVVEEKNSRVMEIILGAASPVELLGGKVLGVGAVALTQYVAVLVPALLVIVLQGQLASILLGEPAGQISLPSGLTLGTILAFSVFLVLGFGLYAVLYAAAGSLVSRQEDVNQMVAPMTLVSTAGYLVAVYASIGLLGLDAPWVVVLSYVPFLSPYLMVPRITAGTVTPIEVLFAIVLLVVTIAICVWIAARIYAAGVLMYGQRPGFRLLARAMRTRR